ncbi:hypothetical protein VTP01DRAFT_7688 [Rhizomucor pusillus]|uniref:uncharacterized protein n=1 Tax=Rhizomucor pusillus TaxID=4840 RepID=UPI003742FA8A
MQLKNAITQKSSWLDQFWYFVCQLILGLSVSNTNTKFPSNFSGEHGFWASFSALHPDIRYPLNVTGYSDILSAACKEIATAYTNHIVENFQRRVVSYIQYKLDKFVPAMLRAIKIGIVICHSCMSKSLKKLKTEDGVTHHGILDCQTCGMLWNRDTNASKNMYFIARKVWEGFGRPQAFVDQINPPLRMWNPKGSKGFRFLR